MKAPVLCLEPEYSYGECPVRCVQLQCRALPGAALPAHKDYLGSLMGLALKREALGDILLPADAPGTAYVFALEPAAKLICRELCQAGRTEVSTRLLEPERSRLSRRRSGSCSPPPCPPCGWTRYSLPWCTSAAALLRS